MSVIRPQLHPGNVLTERRSAGLEEYIEGLSFLHFLEHGTLITLQEVQETLSDKETVEKVGLLSHYDRQPLTDLSLSWSLLRTTSWACPT